MKQVCNMKSFRGLEELRKFQKRNEEIHELLDWNCRN